jgi:hypothetical protein
MKYIRFKIWKFYPTYIWMNGNMRSHTIDIATNKRKNITWIFHILFLMCVRRIYFFLMIAKINTFFLRRHEQIFITLDIVYLREEIWFQFCKKVQKKKNENGDRCLGRVLLKIFIYSRTCINWWVSYFIKVL